MISKIVFFLFYCIVIFSSAVTNAGDSPFSKDELNIITNVYQIPTQDEEPWELQCIRLEKKRKEKEQSEQEKQLLLLNKAKQNNAILNNTSKAEDTLEIAIQTLIDEDKKNSTSCHKKTLFLSCREDWVNMNVEFSDLPKNANPNLGPNDTIQKLEPVVLLINKEINEYIVQYKEIVDGYIVQIRQKLSIPEPVTNKLYDYQMINFINNSKQKHQSPSLFRLCVSTAGFTKNILLDIASIDFSFNSKSESLFNEIANGSCVVHSFKIIEGSMPSKFRTNGIALQTDIVTHQCSLTEWDGFNWKIICSLNLSSEQYEDITYQLKLDDPHELMNIKNRIKQGLDNILQTENTKRLLELSVNNEIFCYNIDCFTFTCSLPEEQLVEPEVCIPNNIITSKSASNTEKEDLTTTNPLKKNQPPKSIAQIILEENNLDTLAKILEESNQQLPSIDKNLTPDQQKQLHMIAKIQMALHQLKEYILNPKKENSTLFADIVKELYNFLRYYSRKLSPF